MNWLGFGAAGAFFCNTEWRLPFLSTFDGDFYFVDVDRLDDDCDCRAVQFMASSRGVHRTEGYPLILFVSDGLEPEQDEQECRGYEEIFGDLGGS